MINWTYHLELFDSIFNLYNLLTIVNFLLCYKQIKNSKFFHVTTVYVHSMTLLILAHFQQINGSLQWYVNILNVIALYCVI